MMGSVQTPAGDIGAMPRGGPDASWLDRRLETGRAEYLDRDDVDEQIKRSVVRSLEWTGDVFKNHERFAYIALEEIADVPDRGSSNSARATAGFPASCSNSTPPPGSPSPTSTPPLL